MTDAQGVLAQLRDAFDRNRPVPDSAVLRGLEQLRSTEVQPLSAGGLTERSTLANPCRRRWEQEEKVLGRLAGLGYGVVLAGAVGGVALPGAVSLAFAALGGALAMLTETWGRRDGASAAACEGLARELERLAKAPNLRPPARCRRAQKDCAMSLFSDNPLPAMSLVLLVLAVVVGIVASLHCRPLSR